MFALAVATFVARFLPQAGKFFATSGVALLHAITLTVMRKLDRDDIVAIRSS